MPTEAGFLGKRLKTPGHFATALSGDKKQLFRGSHLAWGMRTDFGHSGLSRRTLTGCFVDGDWYDGKKKKTNMPEVIMIGHSEKTHQGAHEGAYQGGCKQALANRLSSVQANAAGSAHRPHSNQPSIHAKSYASMYASTILQVKRMKVRHTCPCSLSFLSRQLEGGLPCFALLGERLQFSIQDQCTRKSYLYCYVATCLVKSKIQNTWKQDNVKLSAGAGIARFMLCNARCSPSLPKIGFSWYVH